MSRYKTGDAVTYAGNNEVFTIVEYCQLPNSQYPKLTYYTLEDSKGCRHDCHQPNILRLYKRRFAEV